MLALPLIKHLLNHERILIYNSSEESRVVIDEALRIVQGKEYFEKVIIGIDPGEVFGFVVQADEKVIEKQNCFSIDQVLRAIYRVLDIGSSASFVCVKIGDGIPELKNKLLKVFDEELPSYVRLEIVSEAGTNRHFSGTKHRRGLR